MFERDTISRHEADHVNPGRALERMVYAYTGMDGISRAQACECR